MVYNVALMVKNNILHCNTTKRLLYKMTGELTVGSSGVPLHEVLYMILGYFCFEKNETFLTWGQ